MGYALLLTPRKNDTHKNANILATRIYELYHKKMREVIYRLHTAIHAYKQKFVRVCWYVLVYSLRMYKFYYINAYILCGLKPHYFVVSSNFTSTPIFRTFQQRNTQMQYFKNI